MADTRIATVHAWQALDSRGDPTVGCEVVLRDGGHGSVIVPSGKSTGRHEAAELRDGGERFGGKGVTAAIKNVTGPLAAAVGGLDATDQHAVDHALRQTDGTSDLRRMGANAVLGISLAAALARADSLSLPLYEAVAEPGGPLLPMPMVNILSGGAHAAGALDIQDVLVVPVGATSFAQAIEWAWRVRKGTAEAARDRGHGTGLVADEGGLGLELGSNRRALELITEGMSRAGLRPRDDVGIALDVAAGQFAQGNRYLLRTEGRTLSADELIDELSRWRAMFPVVSVEDVLGEDDWAGWRRATRQLDGIQVLGDDLFATDQRRLARGIDAGVGNAVLVKPNQVGTLSEALDVVRAARQAGYQTVLSARSGDAEDSWLADLSVGWRTGQIKVGSTMRAERTAKWNRLLQIESRLGAAARFASWGTASDRETGCGGPRRGMGVADGGPSAGPGPASRF